MAEDLYSFTIERCNGKVKVTHYEENARGIITNQFSSRSEAGELIEECKGLLDILHKDTISVSIRASNR